MRKMIWLLALLYMATASQAQDYNRNTSRDRDSYQRPRLILNSEEFARVLQAVKKAPFKDEKPDAFRLAMGNNLISAKQVTELIKLTPFDDERLEWVKLAYRYTADKQHFYLLRDKFAFLGTQSQFDAFLLAQGKERPGRYSDVLSKKAYAELKDAIARQPFKDDKKKTFRLAMQDQLMTTAQLRDLILQFTFDDEKLDWITMAYEYTADTNRFYLLREVLTFNSSKEKLDKFLLSQG